MKISSDHKGVVSTKIIKKHMKVIKDVDPEFKAMIEQLSHDKYHVKRELTGEEMMYRFHVKRKRLLKEIIDDALEDKNDED